MLQIQQSHVISISSTCNRHSLFNICMNTWVAAGSVPKRVSCQLFVVMAAYHKAQRINLHISVLVFPWDKHIAAAMRPFWRVGAPCLACRIAVIGSSLMSSFNLEDKRELCMKTSTRGMSIKPMPACGLQKEQA